MLYFGLTAPIRNNNEEIVTVLQELLKADHKARQEHARRMSRIFHHAGLQRVKDPALRQRLEDAATRAHFADGAIRWMTCARAACETLRNSAEFQRLLKDLNESCWRG